MNIQEERTIKKRKMKNSFHKAFSLTGDTADYAVIEERILSGGEVKGTNLCILVLAALIASIGLNMNSTAVIIGAMLISPLMGGIMAIAYGLATSDLKQARNSAMGLCIQVLACLVIATVYFWLTPVKTPTAELMARTSPTIWDVMIACFGGLAGIIGMTREEKSNVIPGVAIATALMPPLCTAGYGIATGNFMYFMEAFYLFLINTYFICLSSVAVLLLISIPKRSNSFDKINFKKLKKRIARNTVILIIPSIFFGWQMVRQEMDTQSQVIEADNGQSMDLETITKELKVISPSVHSIEIVQMTKYKEEAGETTKSKIIVHTTENIQGKEREVMEHLLHVHVKNVQVEWKK